MVSDPLHLSNNSAELPNGADCEAAYAEIMATARGRRFLIEYATRNRYPDTHSLVSAIARLQAAMRDDPPQQIPTAFKRDLTEMAAAIGRIKAKVAASAMPESASLPAGGRIKDIILALRDLAGRVDAMIALAAEADKGAIAATATTSA